FNRLMESLRTLVEARSGPATVLVAVMEQTGYTAELQASSDPQDETRLENIAELEAVCREFEEANPDGTLNDFLEQVSLVADSDEIPDADESGGVVTLMTLHTAKGLQFPVLCLTGMEDGVFPHLRARGGQLVPGDRVSHETFGLGTVVSTAGVAERAEATIDFGDAGVKRLLLRYAPVDKL